MPRERTCVCVYLLGSSRPARNSSNIYQSCVIEKTGNDRQNTFSSRLQNTFVSPPRTGPPPKARCTQDRATFLFAHPFILKFDPAAHGILYFDLSRDPRLTFDRLDRKACVKKTQTKRIKYITNSFW